MKTIIDKFRWGISLTCSSFDTRTAGLPKIISTVHCTMIHAMILTATGLPTKVEKVPITFLYST